MGVNEVVFERGHGSGPGPGGGGKEAKKGRDGEVIIFFFLRKG